MCVRAGMLVPFPVRTGEKSSQTRFFFEIPGCLTEKIARGRPRARPTGVRRRRWNLRRVNRCVCHFHRPRNCIVAAKWRGRGMHVPRAFKNGVSLGSKRLTLVPLGACARRCRFRSHCTPSTQASVVASASSAASGRPETAISVSLLARSHDLEAPAGRPDWRVEAAAGDAVLRFTPFQRLLPTAYLHGR